MKCYLKFTENGILTLVVFLPGTPRSGGKERIRIQHSDIVINM